MSSVGFKYHCFCDKRSCLHNEAHFPENTNDWQLVPHAELVNVSSGSSWLLHHNSFPSIPAGDWKSFLSLLVWTSSRMNESAFPFLGETDIVGIFHFS